MEKANLPWSIKGISPEARQAAKELAADAGKPMGAWLSEAIHHISQQERLIGEGEHGNQPHAGRRESPDPAASPIHGALDAETARPYDTAGYGTEGGADDLVILAQRIAKVERWTARSVAPLRQAIEEITRRMEALERARMAGAAGDSYEHGDPQSSRRRWRP
jgi:hypothetical protein